MRNWMCGIDPPFTPEGRGLLSAAETYLGMGWHPFPCAGAAAGEQEEDTGHPREFPVELAWVPSNRQLGAYPTKAIKSGTFCSYSPDQRDAVTWGL
jgi:hypothetical protein